MFQSNEISSYNTIITLRIADVSTSCFCLSVRPKFVKTTGNKSLHGQMPSLHHSSQIKRMMCSSEFQPRWSTIRTDRWTMNYALLLLLLVFKLQTFYFQRKYICTRPFVKHVRYHPVTVSPAGFWRMSYYVRILRYTGK